MLGVRQIGMSSYGRSEALGDDGTEVMVVGNSVDDPVVSLGNSLSDSNE